MYFRSLTLLHLPCPAHKERSTMCMRKQRFWHLRAVLNSQKYLCCSHSCCPLLLRGNWVEEHEKRNDAGGRPAFTQRYSVLRWARQGSTHKPARNRHSPLVCFGHRAVALIRLPVRQAPASRSAAVLPGRTQGSAGQQRSLPPGVHWKRLSAHW